MRSTVYLEPWTHSYGSPYLIRDDEAGAADAEVVEDDRLSKHSGLADPVARPLAFVDGVRRGEATLYLTQDDGRTARGVAGTHACGCVVVEPNSTPAFGEARVSRLILWGSGAVAAIAPARGGWSWDAQSVPSDDPKAPLDELQLRMRQAEGALAEDLCDEGRFVVADGPLNFALRRDREIVGYVKTHHRALLPPDDHVRVPELRPAERTSLFRLGDDRYSCYLRLTDGPPWAGPWSGIVRLEFPAYCGLSRVAVLADDAAARLPRYAGLPHRDPRAPQNLQPIGALEYRLRHLMGSYALAGRAVHESVAAMYRTRGEGTA